MTNEERIAQLEEQVRVLTTYVTKNVVVSERFVLVDATGKPCGEWSVQENGPVLTMDGPRGGYASIGFSGGGEGEAQVWLSGPGNTSYLRLEAHENWSKFGMDSYSERHETVECYSHADGAEIALIQGNLVRAKLRIEVNKTILDLVAPDGTAKTISNP